MTFVRIAPWAVLGLLAVACTRTVAVPSQDPVNTSSSSAPSAYPEIKPVPTLAPPPPRAAPPPSKVSCDTNMPEQSCAPVCEAVRFQCAVGCRMTCEACEKQCVGLAGAAADACDKRCTDAAAHCDTAKCKKEEADCARHDLELAKRNWNCKKPFAVACSEISSCAEACDPDGSGRAIRTPAFEACSNRCFAKTGCDATAFERIKVLGCAWFERYNDAGAP